MTKQPTDPASVARDTFLDVYRRDIAAGLRHTLDHYQQQFPGHAETIALEWAWLEPESVDGRDKPNQPIGRPDVIGPYRVVDELGRGAQATVYLAEHQKLHRRVALKVLHVAAAGDNTTTQQRFRREAEATAGLEHPGICSIYETGRSDGRTWIAMQHVRGATLASHLQKADALSSAPTVRLPQSEPTSNSESNSSSSRGTTRSDIMRVLSFVEQAARALHAAHEQGLVHRDVKPGNLMVHDDGHPVVLDFGLAHAHDGDDGEGLGLTRSTDVLGTPYYMAPEQLRQQPGGVDCRADVWALGVTLYECLTGQRPFTATSREALYRQILSEEPTAPRQLNSQISRDLEVVLRAALDKEPNRRYQTASEFADDLRRVRCYEPIAAKPVSTWGRVWRWSRRHPSVALSSSIAAVSLVAGLTISLILQTRLADTLVSTRSLGLAGAASKELAGDPGFALLLALKAVEVEDRLETRSALHQAFSQCREEVYFPTAGKLLCADALPGGSLFLTGSVSGAVQCWNRDGGLAWQHQHVSNAERVGEREAVMQLVFAGNDRDRVVAAFRDGDVCLWDLQGTLLDTYVTKPRRIASHAGASVPMPTTDEQMLIGFADGVQLLRLAGTDRDRLELLHDFPQPGFDGTWACSRDWRYVATGDLQADTGSLWQRNSKGDYVRKGPLLDATGVIRELAFSGSRLLIGVQGSDSVCLDLDSDKGTLFGGRGADMVSWLDENRVVAAGYGGKPEVWDATSATLQSPVMARNGRSVVTGFTIATSNAGTMYAACSQDGSIRVFDAPRPDDAGVTAQPRERYALRGHFGLPNGVLFTNGDRDLFSWSSDARLWNLEDDLLLPTLKGQLSYSPDLAGSRLIAGRMVVDKQHRVVLKMPTAGQWTSGASFSSDGKYVANRNRREINVYATADGELVDQHIAKDGNGAVHMVPGSSEVMYVDLEHETITIHNYLTGQNRPGPQLGYFVWGAAHSPDGRSIAVLARPGLVVLFRLDDTGSHGWQKQASHMVSETMRVITYSPEGDQLLVGADDGRMLAFDADLKPTAAKFAGHRQRISSIRYSRCGTRIASSAKDGTARVWRRDGTLLLVLESDGGGLQGCEFSPDGRYLLTSRMSGVRRWYLHTEDLIAAAKARIHRPLLPAERAKYAELLDDR